MNLHVFECFYRLEICLQVNVFTYLGSLDEVYQSFSKRIFKKNGITIFLGGLKFRHTKISLSKTRFRAQGKVKN